MKLSLLLTEAIAKRLARQANKIASEWDINPEYLDRFINSVTDNINYQSWLLRNIEEFIDDYGIDFLEDSPSLSVVANEWSLLLSSFDDIKNVLKKKNINDYDLLGLKEIINNTELNVKTIRGLPAINMKGGKDKYSEFLIHSVYPLNYYFFDNEVSALQGMGEHTSWCTRGSYPYGSRAKSYLKDSPQIIMAFGQKLLGQFAVDFGMAKNVHNKDIPDDVLEPLLPKDFLYNYILKGIGDKSLRYRVMYGLAKYTTPNDSVLLDSISEISTGDIALDLLNYCLICNIKNEAPTDLDFKAIMQSKDYEYFMPLQRLVDIAKSCGGRVI